MDWPFEETADLAALAALAAEAADDPAPSRSAASKATARRAVFAPPCPAGEGDDAGLKPKAARKRPPRDPALPTAARTKKAKATVTAAGKAKPAAAASPAAVGVAFVPRPPAPPPTVTATTDEEEMASPVATATDAHDPLDDMSESVDDDTFLHTMSVSTQDVEVDVDLPSQEYANLYDEDPNLDMYEEEFIDATPKGGRLPNYTQDEDVLICVAWKKISLDPTVGVEQPMATYWVRIKEYFDEHNTSGYDRTDASLRHRWSTIQTDCQKWSSCLTHVKHINPSGCSAFDKLNLAQGLYRTRGKKGEKKKKKGKPFTLHHCWKELQHEEKWKTRQVYEIPNKKKTKSSSGKATIVDCDYEDASSDEDGDGSRTTNSLAGSRKVDGRKYAKENKGKKAVEIEMKASLDAIVNSRKEYVEERRAMKLKEMEERAAAEERRAAAEERRAAAEERMALVEERKIANAENRLAMEQEQKMMFMDTSGFDERQKAYVDLCRDQVLAMKMNMMGAMGTMGGGMGGAMGVMGMGAMGGVMGRGFGGSLGGGMGGFMGTMGGGMGGLLGGMMGAMGGGAMGGGAIGGGAMGGGAMGLGGDATVRDKDADVTSNGGNASMSANGGES